MAVDYLQEYLGIDPNDYSAMEQRIANVSPVGQSILPQAPVLPRASIMDESDFAAATAPLMDRVYGREQAAREKSESLSNELQALQEEMARTSEAEVEKRAALERQMQEIMQQRDVSVSQAEDLASQLQRLESDLGQTTEQRDLSRTRAEDLASELQGVQANLAEITNLRDIAVQDYQEALQQQDVIRQQASENEAMRLEEQRNELLAEREGIITTLEQDFGVQRSELESVIGGLEGQVGDLTGKVGELESVKGTLEGQINDLSSQMQALEVEKQDALAQQDVIRAEAAQSQQDALAQQGEQFATERSALEQQIADLTAQVGQQQAPAETPTVTDVQDGPPLSYQEFIEAGNAPIDYNAYRASFGDNTQLPPKIDDQLFIDDGPSIDEKIGMPPATGEGGLPEGYSYTPKEGMAYTTVMPSPGFRYAYGPDGKRIEVPDNRDSGPPIAPPTIEKLVPPNMLPPKRDDQLFIDDRPTDPRLDRERGVPIGGYVPGGGGIDYGGPQQPIQLIPGSGSGVPAIKEPNEGPLKFRPIQKPIRPKPIQAKPKPISIGGVGGGTYKEFEGPDGRVLSVGVRPPSFSTNPDPRKDKGSLIGQIKGGIIGKNPIVSSGIGGIGARPSMPKPPQKPFFSKMIDRQPRQPMSVGGVGGISGRRSMRPMMRAGGGAISQAIADLQNRLR
jgi:hypothetical protein